MKILRLTGLVVFVGAVFLTFVGTNQLISHRTKDESEALKSSDPDEVSDTTDAANAFAANADIGIVEESTDEPAPGLGRTPRAKLKGSRRNGSEYGVWRDYKGGKWVVETKWDGEKWATKRVYYPANKE